MLLSLLILLSILSYTDVCKRIIPNKLNVLILILTLAAAALNDTTIWSDVAFRFGIVLIPLITLYAVGAMGAGDVKLICALVPIIPLNALIDFCFYMAVLGALLAVVVLLYLKRTPSAHHRTVPYGVAISGAIFILAAQGKLLI